MKFKRKIKNVLIGLLLFLFIGLVYILFIAKPEIISDESLRVEEPPIPELESHFKRETSDSSTLIEDGDNSPLIIETELGAEIEPLPDSQFIGQAVTSYRDKDVSQMSQSDLSDDLPQQNLESEVSTESIVALEMESDLPELSESGSPQIEPITELVDDLPSVNPIRDDVEPSVLVDGTLLIPESNVRIDPERIDLGPSGFLDLDMAKVEPAHPKMLLEEGEQMVVDDINQSLSEFKPVIFRSVQNEQADQSESLPESLVTSTTTEIVPSVFTMPDMDESLMVGEDEVSQQYRQTMAELLSINAKLRDADKENAVLKTQLVTVEGQNRHLAKIIRDINSQIEALTLAN